MTWVEVFEFCFAAGSLWAFVSLLLGGLHGGHWHTGHGHAAQIPGGQGHGAQGHGAQGHAPRAPGVSDSAAAARGWKSFHPMLLNPSCAAVFLAWFGGVGYLLTRHTGWLLWVNVAVSAAMGLGGALLLAAFLHALQQHDKPLDPLDYEMVGVLGRVTANIRPDGVGEVQFVREGARRAVPARSEDGVFLSNGQEVIVTRYDRGIAHVRTWEAMTR